MIDSNKSFSLVSELHLSKVYDKLSKKLFLIDTGACANCLPVSKENTNDEIQSLVVNASGNPVKCFANTCLEIDFEFGKMTDVFHLRAIEQRILGFEFFTELFSTPQLARCHAPIFQIRLMLCKRQSIHLIPYRRT